MNRIFEPKGFFTVPDGTDVSPFLNATDTNQSDVPWGALGDVSIAAGRLKPGIVLWIHCHPVLVLVTYVVSGSLTVHMKGPEDLEPYRLDLHKGQAALCKTALTGRLPRGLFLITDFTAPYTDLS